MEPQQILVEPREALSCRYRVRRAGTGHTIEVSLPKVVVEREARKLDLSPEDFMEEYEIEWLYGNFDGLHARFIRRTKGGTLP